MKVHEFMHEMRQTSAVLGRSSGVSVVFEGSQAKTDGKTIYLPSLPMDGELTHEQVLAMRGFVDHEAGHLRHTDMPRVMSFYDKNQNNSREGLSDLHNALEDVWMEDRVLDEYPGAFKNLKQAQTLTRAKELAKLKEGGPDVEESLANKNVQTSMGVVLNKNSEFSTPTLEEVRTYLEPEADKMGKHYANLSKACKDSSEVIELAKKIYQYDKETPPENQSPEDFDQKAEAGELSDLEGEEGEGENSEGFDPDAQPGEGNPGGEEGEALTERYDGPEAGEESKAAGGLGADMGDETFGGYRVASTSGDYKYTRAKGHGQGGDRDNIGVVCDTTGGEKYDQHKSKLRSNVMTMKNKLRRALLARQQRDWEFGRETGRLDSKRLVAASQGVKTVWKRRTDREDHDTAITILIDLSGSMYGTKVGVARDCAMALSECFEGTSMSYRISGFSNNGGMSRGDVSGLYHRYERTDWSIFKDFDDTLRTTRGSVYRIPSAVGGNNSDYDFVNYELNDLTARPEARKVLFVLSDGQVACRSDAPMEEHCRLIKENLGYFRKKAGIESVGIGIQDSTVTRIYPNNVVVQNVDELSGKAFGMLTNILFKEK